jgi:hypothetical protein
LRPCRRQDSIRRCSPACGLQNAQLQVPLGSPRPGLAAAAPQQTAGEKICTFDLGEKICTFSLGEKISTFDHTKKYALLFSLNKYALSILAKKYALLVLVREYALFLSRQK